MQDVDVDVDVVVCINTFYLFYLSLAATRVKPEYMNEFVELS